MRQTIKKLMLSALFIVLIGSNASAQGMPVYDNTNFISFVKSLLESAPSSSENLIIIPSKEFLPSFDSYSATIMMFSENGDSMEIGRNLYATLKKADLSKKKTIHLPMLERTDGMTDAINDRLRRASCS